MVTIRYCLFIVIQNSDDNDDTNLDFVTESGDKSIGGFWSEIVNSVGRLIVKESLIKF